MHRLNMSSARSPFSTNALRGLLALSFALAAGCATSHSHPSQPSQPAMPGIGHPERGVASWYGPGFHGRDTASGEPYDMHTLTAAHRSLPFGAIVEVRNLDNGMVTRVRINDRGPFKKDRIIDLSNAAAQAIGMLGPGTARVELTLLELGGDGR